MKGLDEEFAPLQMVRVATMRRARLTRHKNSKKLIANDELEAAKAFVARQFRFAQLQPVFA
jgi:hypothetical protein